jgi:hypothetical protein
MPPQQLKVATSDSGRAPSTASASDELAVVAHNREAGPVLSLAEDLLRGASEIAEFVFGDAEDRRRVYHLAVEVKAEQRMPVFRLGNVICARRSTLLRWIAEQEASTSRRSEGV